ncbi:MAG: metallophosphoesterase family protein [Pseudomonadota bacterium]
MRVQDLGVIDGPVLIFGGPYSNLQATQAVLHEADIRGALALCTGDVVAYCARPVDTIATVRAAGCPVVAGNCEKQLAASAPDCGCGFEVGSTCDLLSAGWYAFADARVKAADRHWMAALPDVVTFQHEGARYGVIHGGVSDVARFLWSTSLASALEAEWDALEQDVGAVDHVLAGHSGIPFQRPLRRGTWINAGVVGMPPHHGSPDTAFAVLEDGRVTLHRLKYDFTGAVRDMRNAGLTHGYERALECGYWPSEDVLPPDLRLSLANG